MCFFPDRCNIQLHVGHHWVKGSGLEAPWVSWLVYRSPPWRLLSLCPSFSSGPWTPWVNPICGYNSFNPKVDVCHLLINLNSTCFFPSAIKWASVTTGAFLWFCDQLSWGLLYWLHIYLYISIYLYIWHFPTFLPQFPVCMSGITPSPHFICMSM